MNTNNLYMNNLLNNKDPLQNWMQRLKQILYRKKTMLLWTYKSIYETEHTHPCSPRIQYDVVK